MGHPKTEVFISALTIQQFRIKIVPLQWIFALVVTSILFLVTLAFTIPPLFGRELVFFRELDVEEESIESEERPLLEDD